MQYKDNKETVTIVGLGHDIMEVRKDLIVVWQFIRSCFSRGFWVNERPWINKESWKKNN